MNPRIALLVLVLPTSTPAARAEPLLLCWGKEVFEIDSSQAEKGAIVKHWSWSPEKAPNLPVELHKRFHNLDEVKPLPGGKELLICASNGGWARIDRSTGMVRRHGYARNAHSLEILPRERIIVASSLGGDELLLFDTDTEARILWRTKLPSAHGVVWDSERRSLWALGFEELREYELADWDSATPGLKLKASHRLPSDDGHDLQPVPQSADLILSTEKGVYLFDRTTRKFREHPQLGRIPEVKAVSIHPQTGRIAFTTWTPKVNLVNPAKEMILPNDRPYKVRWGE